MDDKVFHVVVIGGGFGGLTFCQQFRHPRARITVVDRHNHHLFQPLLYQVATAGLSAPEIAQPIRSVLSDRADITVLLDEARDFNFAAKEVVLRERVLKYDYLVLALGGTTSYFGHPEWAEFAPGLKSLEDAIRIRREVLLAFERAENEADAAERARLMTIVVVGGGPTGVELAGSLAELSRYTLARDFRNIKPEAARIMLIEAGPRVLPAFSEAASHFAQERLERLGVEVLTGTAVEDVGPDWIRFAGRVQPVGVVLWAAGVAASPLARLLGAETDRAGRLYVEDTLAVRGLEDVFALGDVAHCVDEAGKPLPGLAQVAKQQGRHLGRSLARHLLEKEPLRPFRFKGRGNTAIVGRSAAVFEQGRFRIRGWFAWVAWALIHVYLLVGFEHRLVVSVQWLWRYLTYERGARLVTDDTTGKDPAAKS
jgi:NADH:ubiquinone reductase (H+-translocating)